MTQTEKKLKSLQAYEMYVANLRAGKKTSYAKIAEKVGLSRQGTEQAIKRHMLKTFLQEQIKKGGIYE